jgi:adenosylcobinamide-phosphate guanylyltransferase
MLALILAGGRGSRLGMGEKPMVTICGSPMIAYVTESFTCAGHIPVVIVSPACPCTVNWCRAHRIGFFVARGSGYIEDLVETGTALDATGPLFTCVADLPLITPRTIGRIEQECHTRGAPACSVWVPAALCSEPDSRREYAGEVDGVPAYPAGINMLRAERIAEPQEEIRLLCRNPRLAANVNTREDLERVRRVLCPAG